MTDDLDQPLFDDDEHQQEELTPSKDSHSWKVLVVDDEQGVHDVTNLALKHFHFQGRDLEFLHAYSAAEGRKIFSQHDDIAVAFIDVVMETDHAGLELIEHVRNEIRNSNVRLILRTGQPGAAPESRVIENYDINDYKDKTELTKQKLTTCLYTALRSYRDIMLLEQNGRGLEQVIASTSSIYSIHDMENFVSGLLKQIISVVGSKGDILYAQSSGFIVGCCDHDDPSSETIVSGTGKYESLYGKVVSEALENPIPERILHAVTNKKNEFYEDGSVFYIHNNMGGHAVIYVNTTCLDDDNHQRLLELFSSNIIIAYENISLNQEIEDTQREIIYTLGTVAEFRSQETSDHVKRVSKYVELLAKHIGLSHSEAELVKLASPLHDIGKLAIPDSILNKPGKLTEEEFELMKLHTTRGYEMLCHSKRPLLVCAAVIAQSHQEKWDGSGYPEGLSGEEIPLYGRLVAVADVFDALGSKRCYKDAWEVDSILDYFREQRGKHFDPGLVDVLMENLDEFLSIRNMHMETA